MKFKQNALAFWETQIVISSALLVSIALMLLSHSAISVLLLPSALLLCTLIMYPFLENKYIVVSEQGVVCLRKNIILWKYQWTEIAELRRGIILRNPGIHIVLKQQSLYSNNPNTQMELSFQLGPTAKKALKKYCKCPINKA